MILPASYANGFAPRDGMPLYPELWRGCVFSAAPCLGPTGLTLRDWSAFRNHGVLTNMLAESNWVMSGGKYALDFDAVNDVVASAGNAALQGAQPRTISAWVYQRSRGNSIFSAFVQIGTNAGQTFVLQCSEAVGRAFTDGVNGGNTKNWTTPPTLSVWQHVAITFSSDAFILYRNGVVDSSGTFSVPINTASSSVRIGARSGFSTMDGQMDDVLIFNRVLSPQEIRLLATRRGIAYEMAPRRRSSVLVAAFNRRRRLLLGSI